MPPFAAINVPSNTTTPTAAATGVRPVVPPEKDSTPSLATVIVPEPLATDMPEPAPRVLRVYPVPLPISNCPSVGIVPKPVPPLVTEIKPVPDPVIVYRLYKNKYHSRAILPSLSKKLTRGAVIWLLTAIMRLCQKAEVQRP